MPFFSGSTSLQCAARNRKVKIVHLLIHAGANVNAGSKDGFTPLSIAATYGNYEAVLALIKNGADKDHQDPEFKFTPLIDALRKGHVDVAKLLVESGANACIKRANGRNALLAAEAYNQPEFVEWYERNGFPKCDSTNE